jgi:hypothetical protein
VLEAQLPATVESSGGTSNRSPSRIWIRLVELHGERKEPPHFLRALACAVKVNKFDSKTHIGTKSN